jgi:uncharacterized MAPEG superfamily protein
MLLSEWALLGFAAWTLGVLVFGIGLTRVTKVMRREAKPNEFNPMVVHGTERYQRCLRAHLNCVENLPLFATLVLLGSVLHVPGQLFQVATIVVLPARAVQSVVHMLSGRNRAVLLRFYAFTVQLVCFGIMMVQLALFALNRS